MERIRQAENKDAERLLEIYAYYVKNTAVTFDYDVPLLLDFAAALERTKEHFPFLILESDESLIGYAYAGPFKQRAAYLHSCETTIYLDHTVRRKGFGRRLYSSLEEELKARGILNLYACISVPRGEDPYLTNDSELFHRSFGFQTAGTFHQCGTKFSRWYDMIWMEKIIGPHL